MDVLPFMLVIEFVIWYWAEFAFIPHEILFQLFVPYSFPYLSLGRMQTCRHTNAPHTCTAIFFIMAQQPQLECSNYHVIGHASVKGYTHVNCSSIHSLAGIALGKRKKLVWITQSWTHHRMKRLYLLSEFPA